MSSAGDVCLPMIIFKGKHQVNETYSCSEIVCVQEKAWIDETLTDLFMFIHHELSVSIMESFCSHSTGEVKKEQEEQQPL